MTLALERRSAKDLPFIIAVVTAGQQFRGPILQACNPEEQSAV
jgi:hypothetical protein